MRLTATVWSSPEEKPGDFVDATTKVSGFTFDTSAMGGFGDASFTIRVSGWNAVRWYRSYLGFHVVIFDSYGRRVYEGRIEDTDAAPDGIGVTCLGYYSHAKELVHGMVYPAGFVLTPTQLVIDTVDIAFNTNGTWAGDYSMIQKLTQNIAPQDFSGEKKLADAIDMAVKFGNDAIFPKLMYFAIWDHRRAYFYEEPALTTEPQWRVYKRDFNESDGLSISRSRSTVWNKIQVIYDDPDIGQTFTGWAENRDSQRLYGVKEGTLNIGQSLPGLAEVIRDLAINSYAFPTQSSQLGISGKVYTPAGRPENPYMVRAGGLVQVMDYDPSVAQLVGGSTGSDASVMFISRTSYDADSNSLTIDMGSGNVALDILMARLGTGSGGIS
jgi:hypothetical protein